MDVRQTKNYGDKTEFLIFGATQQLLKLNSSTVCDDIRDIKPVFEVRTLGSSLISPWLPIFPSLGASHF